jgi:class 3 adenylate cyclase
MGMVDDLSGGAHNKDAQRLDPEGIRAGDVLGGRFTVVRMLGAGAQGHVFLATDRELSTPVVVKVLSLELAEDPESRENFRREVVSARAVSHPNVVRVFDFHTLQGLPAMTMEHLPRGTLRELLSRRPLPSLGERLRILADVADGLNAVHAAGIIHRDIKPANVLFGDDGRPRLSDFGIALKTTSRQNGAPRYTPFYASPEQIRGKDITTASDLYALGAMAFHVLAGQPPFSETGRALLDAHRDRKAPPLTLFVPDVPAVASEILARCLEKEPQGRPARAADVGRALRTAAVQVEPRRDVSVLFIDLVAFSALATQTQSSTVQVLNKLVANCPAVADQPPQALLKLPTGDGLALVFMEGPVPAMTAAMQLARSMTQRDLEARMGLHHGSVLTVTDVNEMRNVTGSGVNLAQRVMSLGDHGHLLASDQFRDVLLSDQPDLAGAFQGPWHTSVKHGVQLTVWNVVWDGVGRAELPAQLRPTAPRGTRPGMLLAASGAGALLTLGAVLLVMRLQAPAAVTVVDAGPPPAVVVVRDPPVEPVVVPREPVVEVPPVVAQPVVAPAHERPRKGARKGKSTPTVVAAAQPAPVATPAPEPRVAPAPAPQPTPAPAPPPPPLPRLEDAKAQMVAGNYGEAIRMARQLVEQDGSNADAHKLLGNALVLAKKPCKAKKHFEAFIRLAPGSPLVPGIQQRLAQADFASCAER